MKTPDRFAANALWDYEIGALEPGDLADLIRARDAEVGAGAWLEGHAAGRDYAGDGWNSDAHDPAEENPYLRGGAATRDRADRIERGETDGSNSEA